MLPQIEFIGSTFSTYSLFALFGALFCGALFCNSVRKQGHDSGDAIVFLFSAAAGAILGSHLQYALVNIELLPFLFSAPDFQSALKIANLLFGGAVFYGGLFGGMLFGYFTTKIMRLDRIVYAESIAPIIPLFHGIARIGCFFAGCCYGIECDFGFSSKENPFIPDVVGITRFPVQLLEALLNFLLFIFLSYLHKKGHPKLKGNLLTVYLICYSVVRFFDEFLRGDEIRGFIGMLSTSQFISIIVFSISLLWLFIRHKKSSKSL